MAILESNALENFHEFIGRQLASESGASMSPEQALALWREFEETTASVRDGLADIEAGRIRPADEVLREVRRELGLQ